MAITKKITPIYLHDLLLMKLQALYDIETQLVSALPKMAKKAMNEDLSEAFTEHLEETKVHVGRLDQAFDILDKKPKKLKCEGIRGIIEDAEWVLKKIDDPAARDANTIAAAQYAEHYEMAGYQSAVEWAELLGFNDISELLRQTLEEEKTASDKLSSLASGGIDEAAMGDDTEEGEAEDIEEEKA